MADLVFVEVGTELGLKNPHHFDRERTELEISGNLAQIVFGSEHLEVKEPLWLKVLLSQVSMVVNEDVASQSFQTVEHLARDLILVATGQIVQSCPERASQSLA